MDTADEVAVGVHGSDEMRQWLGVGGAGGTSLGDRSQERGK